MFEGGTWRWKVTTRTFLLAIGIASVFTFLWMGNRVVTPASHAQGVRSDFQKAGREFARVGKKITGIVREVTAYNVGVREQTSDTPCIGASGRNLCNLVERDVKVCAANFVALWTILKIDNFGECVVLDRMHSRFSHRVDIAMRESEIKEAREFGLQRRIVEAIH
jgi:3D (Asp-Asp-Asp) domain-containing protein